MHLLVPTALISSASANNSEKWFLMSSPWALQDNGTRPASYPFVKGIATGTSWHHRSHTMGNRVLPVRNIK